MDELIRLIHSAGCAALGRALAHSLWQGAALAALLALVAWRLGARARLRGGVHGAGRCC